MDLEIAKKLIKKYEPGHASFLRKANEAERYYRKENNILYGKKTDDSAENPLRNSDNRIPSNFYRLQVNQKAAYAFTVPPKFHAGDDALNDLVRKVLGDAYAKKCKKICIQAAKTGISWVHYWGDKKKGFRYEVVDSREIIPIWTKGLEKELLGVLRSYPDINDEDGLEYVIYEFWTEKECQAFRRKVGLSVEEGLYYYECYPTLQVDSGATIFVDTYRHGFDEVPFIFFNNNDSSDSDLQDIRELIDAYDKVFSGFLNDLEDIQELIFILTNYGGESESALEVLHEMKQKKVIQVDSDGADDRSGISTLAIEIPVEARKEMLSITRKAIFEQGMAIDPDPQNFGNSSGVALQYLYSLLELKTGMMQTEFELSFNRLVRAILRFHGVEADTIIQTWKRSSVHNDAELADIAQKSRGVISDETIVRNHPWVSDAEEEIRLLKLQRQEEEPSWDTVPVIEGGERIGEEK